MNDHQKGSCWTNGQDVGKYLVPGNRDGQSVLTGDGNDTDDEDQKTFTVKELEVFLVK